MPLTREERQQVIDTAVDLLRHRASDRVLSILADRLDRGDYDDEQERDLDEIALVIARAIRAELEDPTP